MEAQPTTAAEASMANETGGPSTQPQAQDEQQPTRRQTRSMTRAAAQAAQAEEAEPTGQAEEAKLTTCNSQTQTQIRRTGSSSWLKPPSPRTSKMTFEFSQVCLEKQIPRATLDQRTYRELFDKSWCQLECSDIVGSTLTQIGATTGDTYSNGHILKLGSTRVIGSAPITLDDPCLLVVLRGRIGYHSYYSDGTHSPTTTLPPDQAVRLSKGSTIRLMNESEPNGEEPSFLAWLEIGRTYYTAEQRAHAKFLLDSGMKPSAVAAEIGPKCTPSMVLRWAASQEWQEPIREKLQKMVDDALKPE